MATLAAQEASSNGVAVLEPEPLPSSSDAERLAELERVVAAGIETAAAAFVSLGLALGRIRDERLFAVTDAAFKQYVQRRWGARVPVGVRAHLRGSGGAGDRHAARAAGGYRARRAHAADTAAQQGGPAAVASAWAPIAERSNGRPPSRSDIRAALLAQGLVTTAPERAAPVQLRSIEAGLIAAEERLGAVRERAPLSPAHRERAARCAEIARRLSEGLAGLADVSQARAELKRLEPVAAGVMAGTWRSGPGASLPTCAPSCQTADEDAEAAASHVMAGGRLLGAIADDGTVRPLPGTFN